MQAQLGGVTRFPNLRTIDGPNGLPLESVFLDYGRKERRSQHR
ncbi:hypothetical protein [Bacillus thuringiensis]|nr:hypothetical protein [Bacillus thuringiensis]